MDESFDLFDDSLVGTDNAGNNAYSETELNTAIPDSGPDGDNIEDSGIDIPDSDSELDNSAGNPETEPGTDDLTGTESGGENADIPDGIDTENGDSTDVDTEPGTEDTETDEADGAESEGINTEILTEMNATLHIHTENVQTFFADTVSGNAVTVTPDDSTAALFIQGIENQTLDIQNQLEILDRLDMLNGSVMLLFVVLAFDLLHRFAKRIVRNLMKGDAKNGTDI